MARGDFRQRVVFELVDESRGAGNKIAGVFEKIKKNALLLAAGAAAFKAVSAFIELLGRGRDLAAEQELADRKLSVALRALGADASIAAAGLKDQANKLQKLGVASNESIQSTQAFIANLGVSADQIELATQASVDLSAALGISLESAARNVGRTVGGFAGELGELLPELSKLSTEALKAGAGIELVAKQFGGQAAAQATTFTKSIKRFNEAMSDSVKILGESLADAGASKSYRNLALAIEQLNEATEGSRAAGALGFFLNLGEVLRNTTSTVISVSTGLLEHIGILGSVDEATAKRVESSKALQLQLKAERLELEKKTKAEADALKATNDFNAAVEALGVTLDSEVNKALEKNNALLIEADIRLRTTGFTLGDYRELELAVAAANAELRGELVETIPKVGEFDQAIRESGLVLDGYARQSNAAGQAIQNLGIQTARVTSGLRARGAQGQRAVDTATARAAAGGFTPPRLSSDGTRIIFRGGSRLAEP
jgi:hypothetical protein